jgi:hypothetical protein
VVTELLRCLACQWLFMAFTQPKIKA